MSPAAYRKPRSSASTFVLPGVLLIGIAAAVGVLWSLGLIHLGSPPPGPAVPPGAQDMITCVRLLPAYKKVTREDVYDFQANHFSVTFIPKDSFRPNMKRGAQEVVGRVLKHDMHPGYVFTEEDFYPRGTRGGETAPIHSGQRLMRIEADKISGIAGLDRGDHFDLLATMKVDPAALTALPFGGASRAEADMELAVNQSKAQATVRVIVQNGFIIQPMTIRNVPIMNMSLTNGAQPKTKPVQEVVIGVAAGEVAPLTEAFAVGYAVTCVPRSGQPDESDDDVTPENDPRTPLSGLLDGATGRGAREGNSRGRRMKPFAPVEEINGTNHTLTVIPRATGDPQLEPDNAKPSPDEKEHRGP